MSLYVRRKLFWKSLDPCDMSVVPSVPFPALGLITDLVFQPSAWSLSFLSLQFYLVLNHFHPKAALHVRKKKLLLIYVRGYWPKFVHPQTAIVRDIYYYVRRLSRIWEKKKRWQVGKDSKYDMNGHHNHNSLQGPLETLDQSYVCVWSCVCLRYK